MKFFGILLIIALLVWAGVSLFKLIKLIINKRKEKKENNDIKGA